MGHVGGKTLPPRRRRKKRVIVAPPRRNLPVLLLQLVGLALFAVLVGGIWMRSFTSWRTGNTAEPGFEIVTAPEDRAHEIVYGPSTLVIDSGTQVVLPRVGRLAGREITLQRGRVTARVRRLQEGETFTVRTAQAVVGVLGTVFSVAIQNRSRTVVSVEEGSVEVKGLVGDPVVIVPGQTVVVEAAKPAVVEGPAIRSVISRP